MQNASNQLKTWAKANTKYRFGPRWHFSSAKLGLKSIKYVHCCGKGWQTGVILQWLAYLVENHQVTLEDDVKTLVWAANNFISLVHEVRQDSLFLTQGQADQVHTVGMLFVQLYLALHQHYVNRGTYKLFNPRPKLHILVHLLDSTLEQKRNPIISSAWLDEGWLKLIMSIARKTHKLTTQSSTLKRYLTGLGLYVCVFMRCQVVGAARLEENPSRGY